MRYAERTNLIEMQPRGDLASTGFALAHPGEEYLVLQPSEASDPFTVKLEPGTYAVEWFSVEGRETAKADDITAESSTHHTFGAPFGTGGSTVLYLKKVEDPV